MRYREIVFATIVALVLGVGCAQLMKSTGLESIKSTKASGESVGCGPIDPVTKMQNCEAADGKGNVTVWTVNHNSVEVAK